MKSKLVILSSIILLLIGCTSKKEKDFPAFTLDNVSEDSTVVAITYNEFIKNYNENLRYQSILEKKKLSQKEKDEIYTQTFTYLENKKKLNHEYDYLGLQITEEEEKDFIYGNHIDEKIKSMPMFINRTTNEFDKSLIKPFIEKLSKNKSTDPYFIWNEHIKRTKESLLRNKYESLLLASYINTNTFNEWHNKLAVGETTVKAFSVPYSIFYDSIDPTDEDFQRFMSKKSYDYQISDHRYIRAATIPAKIHKHFHEKEYNALSRYLETFDDFNEIAKQNDFIKTFSSFYTDKTIPKELNSFFSNGKPGDYYGPFFENNSYRVIKINTIDNLPTEAKAQHVVINNISKEIILSIKKDIEQKVKEGASFLDLAQSYAKKYGEDGKWGNLDWFTYGEMVDDFSDSVFMNQPGDITLSQSQYGWHIVKVTEHRDITKKYNFTALYWPLTPVEEDLKATLQAAKEFISDLDNPGQFESKTSEKGYPVEEFEANGDQKEFIDFDNSYEIFNWAYNSFENEIKAFRVNDQIMVVKLYKIGSPGLMPVFKAREYIRNGVFNSVVKDYLDKRLNPALYNKMEVETAAKYFRAPVFTIKGITFTDVTAPKIGSDPYLVGIMTAMKPGEKSHLIYGNQRFAMFEKIAENDKQISTAVAKNKLQEWKTNVKNGRYKYAFKRNDKMAINLGRKQDSYFLVPTYENYLKNDTTLAAEMYLAEYAFRNKEYKNALYGTKDYKGFASLVDKSPGSVQQRLILIYAGLSALQTGEYQKVIDFMSKLETEDRFFSIVKYGAMGDAYSQMGNDQKALEYYLKADNANNNFVIGAEYIIKAVAIYDKMGEYKKALDHYNQLKTKYGPSRHNYDSKKYIGHYEYMSNKSELVITE